MPLTLWSADEIRAKTTDRNLIGSLCRARTTCGLEIIRFKLEKYKGRERRERGVSTVEKVQASPREVSTLTQKCVEVRGTKTRSVQFPSLNSFFFLLFLFHYVRKKSVNSYSEIDCKLFIDTFYTTDIRVAFHRNGNLSAACVTDIFIYSFICKRTGKFLWRAKVKIEYANTAHEYSSRRNGNYLKLLEIT